MSPQVHPGSFRIARLPFVDAQAKFAKSPVIHGSAVSAKVGWHGTSLDIERGSFVLVPIDGKLSYLLGEWLKITVREGVHPRSVYAYCHSMAEFPPNEDLSLSRRLYLSLAPLSTDPLTVTVEVLS